MEYLHSNSELLCNLDKYFTKLNYASESMTKSLHSNYRQSNLVSYELNGSNVNSSASRIFCVEISKKIN